jgi:hypothetical protein
VNHSDASVYHTPRKLKRLRATIRNKPNRNVTQLYLTYWETNNWDNNKVNDNSIPKTLLQHPEEKTLPLRQKALWPSSVGAQNTTEFGRTGNLNTIY